MAGKQWAREVGKIIRATIRRKYGSGWELLSNEQQVNAFAVEILHVVNAQLSDEIKPAQRLIISLWNELNEEDNRIGE